MKRLIAAVDRVQQRHAFLAFPYAVTKKFSDDRAGHLAALVAYYTFFSLFPLLLVLVTVLGLVLRDNPDLQDRIVDTALAQFPVIGPAIKENLSALPSSGLALAVGIAGSLWAGTAVFKVAQNGMNSVWDVPMKREPNLIKTLLRAVVMLVVLGGFLILSSGLAGIATAQGDDTTVVRVLAIAGTVVVNVLLFLVAFKVLTVEDVRVRDVLPGAAIAGILWSGLQALGTYYVARQVQNASAVYGLFAMVIGLLSWVFLGAQITLMCAELNVVRVKRLWPRSLTGDDLTEADRRALVRYARVEERREDQRVDVTFEASSEGDDEGDAGDAVEPARTRAGERA